MLPVIKNKGDYQISTKKSDLDIAFIHQFLTNESTWAKGISFDIVQKSIENSLNFGLYHNKQQIGFARVISDYTTIAYLGDVFIIKEHRGKKLSNWLIDEVKSHPELFNLRRWILLTSTANWLYKKHGFTELQNPDIYMEKHDPNIYK